MSDLVFEILSPAPGERGRADCQLRCQRHDPDPGHFPKYDVDTVTVRLSARRPSQASIPGRVDVEGHDDGPTPDCGRRRTPIHGDRQRNGERG